MMKRRRWVVPSILVVMVALCTKCTKEEAMQQPVQDPQMHLTFENPTEPLSLLPDRPVDPTDAGNGCLPGYEWNEFYLYNVCLAPTCGMSDFAIERSDRYARTGEHSIRFFLKPTPFEKWPLGEATHRAELRPNTDAPFARYPVEGEERWYGLSVYFPENFVFAPAPLENELRFMLAQWQHGSEGSPIFSLEVHGNKIAVARSRGESINAQWIPPVKVEDISRGKWTDIVANVKWSKQSGSIRVWVNETLRFEKNNIQTIYDNLDNGGGFKFGIYHWRWKYKESVQKSLDAGIFYRELFMDEVREFVGENGYLSVAPGKAY